MSKSKVKKLAPLLNQQQQKLKNIRRITELVADIQPVAKTIRESTRGTSEQVSP